MEPRRPADAQEEWALNPEDLLETDPLLCGQPNGDGCHCTLERRHPGDHVACDDQLVYDRWPQALAVAS